MLNKSALLIKILLVLIGIFLLLIAYWFYYPTEGTVETPDGGTYSGQLRGSLFHGYGTWEMKNGVLYQGNFRHGLFDGYGTLTYINGSQYIGEFKEGYFHGHGKIITADGKIIEGIWDKGTLVE